ncbi:MAG TPA: hypothetical protein VF985_10240 [Mariniflexile sp.]
MDKPKEQAHIAGKRDRIGPVALGQTDMQDQGKKKRTDKDNDKGNGGKGTAHDKKEQHVP